MGSSRELQAPGVVRRIPHTYENTNLVALSLGDPINIECDVLAKYVEKLLSVQRTEAAPPTPAKSSPVTLERLVEEGF